MHSAEDLSELASARVGAALQLSYPPPQLPLLRAHMDELVQRQSADWTLSHVRKQTGKFEFQVGKVVAHRIHIWQRASSHLRSSRSVFKSCEGRWFQLSKASVALAGPVRYRRAFSGVMSRRVFRPGQRIGLRRGQTVGSVEFFRTLRRCCLRGSALLLSTREPLRPHRSGFEAVANTFEGSSCMTGAGTDACPWSPTTDRRSPVRSPCSDWKGRHPPHERPLASGVYRRGRRSFDRCERGAGNNPRPVGQANGLLGVPAGDQHVAIIQCNRRREV